MTSTEARPAGRQALWFRVEGSEVCLLRDGAEAFPAMLEAIAAARREVLVEYYWIAGKVGRRFREALAEVAARGVEVRVVYDALGTRGASVDEWASLIEAGGLVREYNPILAVHDVFRLERLTQRDHRKLLVVDGELGYTGGINLGDEWLPRDEGGAGWRDYAIAVRGDVARELRSIFYRTWQRVTHERSPLDVAPLARSHGRKAFVLASQRRRRRSIHREYHARFRGARRTIDLAHAYFSPDAVLRHALYRAADRGVRVRVLMPAESDVPGFQFLVEAMFPRYLRHGIELYLAPPPMLHAKLAVIDRQFVTVGSYNLDEGLRKNLEANVAVIDGPFAAHVSECFERDLANATRVDATVIEGRSFLRRGAEWMALALRGLR